MKKHLLNIILACCLLFLGVKSASASAYKVTVASLSGTPNTIGLSNTPIAATSSNYAVAGFSITGSGTTIGASTITSLTFTENGTTNTDDYQLYTTAYLYSSTSATWLGPTNAASTLICTEPADATYNPTFTGLSISVSNTSAAQYFFIVLSNTLGNAMGGNFYLEYTSSTVTGTAVTLSGVNSAGPTYTFANPATATTATVTSLNTAVNPAAPTNGLQANPITATGTKLPIYGLKITPSATGSERSITALNFTAVTTPAQNNNYFFGNMYLYSCTSPTYSAAASTLVSTIVAGATTTANFTGLNILLDPGVTLYYFVLADYNTLLPASTNYELNYTSNTSNTTVTGTGTTTGYNYNFTIVTPFALTINSVTTTANTNGLSATPIPYPSTNYAVAVFNLVGSGSTAGTTTINSLTFTQNGTSTNADNTYYTTAYLYSSTSATYVPGTTNVAGSLVSTATSDGTTTIVFPTSISTSNSTNMYYFVVLADDLGNSTANTFRIHYASATTSSTAVTTGAATNGPAYTFSAPIPVVITLNSLTTTAGTNGLSATPVPISSANYGVFGFSLVGTGTAPTTGTINSLTFTQNGTSVNADNTYYTTAYLYSSTTNTYVPGTTNVAGNLVSTATSDGTTTIVFPTSISVTKSTNMYYFVVLGDDLNNGTANTFRIHYASDTFTTTGVTAGATTNGPAYTFSAPTPFVVTLTSLTTTAGNNGLSATPIPVSSANYSVYGFSLVGSGTIAGTGTINSLTFTQNGTSANADNTYYTTAYLYSSTSATYVAGTTNVAGNLVSTVASNGTSIITFPTTSISVTNSTNMYYFIVFADDLDNGTANTFRLTYTSNTFTTTGITAGATVNGPAYTFTGPTLTATDIPAADLTNTAIYVGQTNIAVAGIQLKTNASSTTLSQLVFTFTPTALATANQYFTNLRLVSSTTALSSPFNYASTSTVTGSSIVLAAGTVTVTIPTVTVNTTAVYYYLVLDYTVQGGATPKVFTFIPFSYTTALTGKINTGYASNTFTCTTPTYYWTGAAGTTNWTTANNWEISIPTGYFVNGDYPGEYLTTDNADVSPSVTTPTIVLSSNITVATITFEPGVATTLNINGSGITLNIATQLNIGSTTSGAAASSLTLGGGGILDINTDAELNYSSTLIVPTNGNITIDNGVNVNFNGTTGQIAKITLSGGLIQSNGGLFEFNNAGAILSATAGTWNAISNTNIDLLAANNQIINNGATINVFDSDDFTFNVGTNNVTNTSGTFNITNTDLDVYNGTLIVNGGIFNVNSDAGGGSDVELGEIVYFFGFPIFETNGTMTVNGGTVNLSGASLIHTAWTASTLTNNGGIINATTASTIFADYAAYNNTSGTANINASTVELAVGGTSLTNGGTMNFTATSFINYTYQNSSLSNTGTINTANTTINFNSTGCALSNTAGSFNFGSGSVMNLTNSKDAVTNSGSGTFTCGPTSIMNLSYAGTAANAATVTNTSSNPFTLLSDVTGSATIGKIATIGTNGSFIGLFNVQRYISTASRNYRLLAAPVNQTKPTPGTAGSPNLVDISDLGQSVTSPATYNGAFIGGPGSGFSNYVANPLLYLYQESILPGTTENSTFTSGKNVGITAISVGSPYLVTTMSTAAGGTNASDNSSSVKIPAGNAYLLYYIHDNTSTSVTSPLTTATTTATGYINQGAIPFILWGSGTLTTLMTLTTGTGALYPGVTMVGNPYPSTIDLQQVYKDNIISGASVFTSGTGEAFYELDPSTEQFASYNFNGTTVTTSGSDASRYIASGQGFYVTVVNNGKPLTFNEDQKTASTTTPTFPSPLLESFPANPGATVDNVSLHNKTADAVLATGNVNSNGSAPVNKPASAANKASGINHTISLALASTAAPVSDTAKKGKQYDNTPGDTTTTPTPPTPPKIAGLHLKLVMNSLTYDECGVYFNNQWSDNADNNDAKDLDGTGGQVYLSSYSADDVRTSINALSDYRVTGKRVKLYVRFSAAGIYQLQLNDLQNFDEDNYSVFLIDNLNKDSLDLTLYKSYNFNYAPGTPNDSTRFILAIEHKPVPQYALLTFAGQKVTQGVQLNWTVKNEANTTKFVLQKLGANNTYAFLDSLQSDSSSIYSYVDQHPSLGSNTYRLQQTTVLGVITYSAPVTIGYNSTSPNGGLNIYPNPAKTSITVTLSTSSLATQVATIDIFNTSGTLIEHKAVNSNSFTHDVSSYQLGVYIIELKNSNGLLVGKSKFVKVQ